MILGILITLISIYFQQKFFKQNETWREVNRAQILDRKEKFAMPGYRKKSTITVFFVALGLLITIISITCSLLGIY